MIEKAISIFLNKTAKLFLFLQSKVLLWHGKEHVFYEHIMDPSFEYRRYKHIINPYFKQYGFKYSVMEGEYYKAMTGIESDLYIPQTFLFYYLIPFLNKASYHQDKNMFRKILGNKGRINYIMPLQIVYNMEGVYYSGDNEACSIDEAVKLIMNYPKDIIVKPTTHTTWGNGIIRLNCKGKTEEGIRELFKQYKKNFSFEERIVQHEDLATFNESSLNTIRVVTYRKLSGEIKYLYALQRFGGKGSVVDNASSGGGFVALSEDGVVDRTIKKYKSLKTEELPQSVISRIPYFHKIKETAVYLHSKVPDLNYIGWDMSITQEGIPVLIEFNSRPAVEIKQISSGPVFSKEDLDEIMPEIAKWKVSYNCNPIVTFPKKKGFNGPIKY